MCADPPPLNVIFTASSYQPMITSAGEIRSVRGSGSYPSPRTLLGDSDRLKNGDVRLASFQREIHASA